MTQPPEKETTTPQPKDEGKKINRRQFLETSFIFVLTFFSAVKAGAYLSREIESNTLIEFLLRPFQNTEVEKQSFSFEINTPFALNKNDVPELEDFDLRSYEKIVDETTQTFILELHFAKCTITFNLTENIILIDNPKPINYSVDMADDFITIHISKLGRVVINNHAVAWWPSEILFPPNPPENYPLDNIENL